MFIGIVWDGYRKNGTGGKEVIKCPAGSVKTVDILWRPTNRLKRVNRVKRNANLSTTPAIHLIVLETVLTTGLVNRYVTAVHHPLD